MSDPEPDAARPVISTADFDAVLFDLDGVVTQTEKLHTIAWKRLFDEFLDRRSHTTGTPAAPFDAEADYLEYVDGKQRYDGVRSFLAARGIVLPEGDPDDAVTRETVCGLGNRKNAAFLECLAETGAQVFDSTVALVHTLRARGMKIAIVSSSKNCRVVLERAGIDRLFDVRVDGVESAAHALPGKPAPDTYLEAARRLDVAPARAVVVEDANSGVEAGHRGRFGLVLGVARRQNHAALVANGADVVVPDLAEVGVSSAVEVPRVRNVVNLPSALERFDALADRLARGRMVVFLDYDGTLTPIVSRPELARLADDVRRTVAALAARCPVALVSGRDRADLERLVGLDGCHYAGSHGFDIRGPSGLAMQHPEGLKCLPLLDDLETRLNATLAEIPGVLVERKKFTLAVHFRNVAPADVAAVEASVDALLADRPALHKTVGKMVFEVRPRLDWHKGKAAVWLLEALDLDGPDVVPVFVGDDATDEDAFTTLAGRAVTVVVANGPRPSAAAYTLRDPGQVHTFLRRLAERHGG